MGSAHNARVAIQNILFPADPSEWDGIIGPKTRAAFDRLSGTPAESEWPPAVVAVDDRSERNIETLLPDVQPRARQFVQEANEVLAAHGLRAVITSGTRTFSEQNALYEQGRTKPGKIVTNVRGGFSNHNFGIALDITLFKGSVPVWESPHYRTISDIGKRLGFKWGGDWQGGLVDEPHYEYNPRGYSVAQLRERFQSGRNVLT